MKRISIIILLAYLLINIVPTVSNGETIDKEISDTQSMADVFDAFYDYINKELFVSIPELKDITISAQQIKLISAADTEIDVTEVEKSSADIILKTSALVAPNAEYTICVTAENGNEILRKRILVSSAFGLVVKRIFISDENGVAVVNPKTNNKLILKADLYNPYSEQISGSFYIAQYKDDVLINIDLKSETFETEEEKSISLAFEYQDCDECKVYFLEDHTMKPLSYTYTVPMDFPEPTPTPVPQNVADVPDFYFFNDALDSLTFYQNEESKTHPLWKNPELFNTFYSDENGNLAPAMQGANGQAWVGKESITDYAVSAKIKVKSDTSSLMFALRHTDTVFYGGTCYAAGFYDGGRLAIVKYPRSSDGEATPCVMNDRFYSLEGDFSGEMTVSVIDNRITLYLDGKEMLCAEDENAVLTHGGAGIIAEEATAFVSDFSAFALYDKNGGHVDNFLGSNWDTPTETLRQIVYDDEKSKITSAGLGGYHYTTPEFSANLDGLTNYNRVSPMYAKGDMIYNGRYAEAGGGITIINRVIDGNFSVEIELKNASGTVMEMLDDADRPVWTVAVKDNALTCQAKTLDLSDVPNENRHLVLSIDGTDMNVYINGALIGSIETNAAIAEKKLRFFRSMNGMFGSLNIYAYALSPDEVLIRYGAESERFNDFGSVPTESIDFTRYVYPNSRLVENKAQDGANIYLPQECVMRKNYERTVYDKNVYYLNTVNSVRNVGMVIGTEDEEASYRNLDDMTLAMWLKVDSGRTGQSHRLFSYGTRDRSSFGYEAYIAGTTLYLSGAEFTDRSNKVMRTVDFSDYTDRWIHLAFVRHYDKTTQSYDVVLYVDATPIYSETIKSSRVSEDDMLLGIGVQPNFANPMWGAVGSADFYPNCLSKADVEKLFRSGIMQYKTQRKSNEIQFTYKINLIKNFI